MRFRAYVLSEGDVEFEVTNKIRTDVRGHYTYMLQGVTDRGRKANALVNRSQYDRFDVPSEERSVERKIDRKSIRRKSIEPARRPASGGRRALNEEVERWLAEHNGIDFDSLDCLDDIFSENSAKNDDGDLTNPESGL